MDVLKITGPAVLHGRVSVAGSKNAALPIMAASLLTDAPLLLDRVPQVTDVQTLSSLLRSLGVDVTRHDDALRFDVVDRRVCRAPAALVRRMRASICVLGPLLARRGRAIVPLPGGCTIGDRPIELHLRGLAALGADITLRNGCCVASAKRLRGTSIDLTGPFGPTVTGTANVMSAAALAYGRTIILGAACEPEVVALGTALNSLGARIAGLGTERIEINGVESLAGGRVENIPDRIEAATLLIAGAITGGTVKVTGALASHLDQVLAVLDDSGAEITVRHEATSDTIAIRVPRRLRAMSVITQPYPGVPTDVQPLLTALATRALGTTRVVDQVFPERWGHVRGLRRLGAKVVKQAQGCTVQGVPSLQGASTRGTDLRGTAALVLAALAADGSSRISGLQHLDRGYDRLEFKLAQLGAPVERVAFRQHQPVAAR